MKKNLNLIIFILFFLFFTNAIIAYSSCSKIIEGNALALQGKEANTVKIKIEPNEGEGILLNITSIFGKTTQESIANAYFLASSESGKKCQFTITFENISDEINGPSAGLPLSLIFYEIESNQISNKYFTATGAIEKNGDVYSVGGLYEKALASIRNGFDVFIYPDYIEDETIIVQDLFQNIATKAIPVKDFNSAKKVVFENQNEDFSIENYIIKDPIEKVNYDSKSFEKYAIQYIKLEEENAKKLSGFYREYAEKNIEMQKRILEKEYYYTVANDAFNKYAMQKAYTIESSEKKDDEREELFKNTKNCLDILENNFMNETIENAEIVVGAKVRYYRALETLDYYNETTWQGTFFEDMEKTASLVKAKLWCESATEMNSNAKEGIIKLNKNKLKEDAIAIKKEISNKNLEEPLRMQKMLEKNDYLAYLYESAFLDILNKSKEIGNDEKEYKTFWANIYASQARYIENTKEDPKELYKIANNMEYLFLKIKSPEYIEKIIIGGEKSDKETENYISEIKYLEEKCTSEKISMLLFFAVLIALVIIIWKFLKLLKKS